MKILIANIGSTSLKWRLFNFSSSPERMLHKGGFERVTDYPKAIEDCLAELKKAGAIQNEAELAAVGFKTVLAKDVTGCVRLEERVLKAMADYNGIAPAHNPPYIAGIKLFAQRMPDTPLVGLFETAFYQFAPPAMMRYAVPAAWYDAGIRRFGFHGASHKFIAERSAELLCRPDIAKRAQNLYVDGGKTKISGPPLRVISCHLGGSSSVTGILNGAAIGTSMGMSPQSGLPQNNRVGDLDAEAVAYSVKTFGITIEEAQRQLSKESGLKGLSGVSNDIREVQDAAAKGNASAQMALDVFVASARHWIGSYFFELNGADAIVFTAGIGENRPELRQAICANLDRLGIKLDDAKNTSIKAQEGVISAASSTVKVLVIPTNEELVVAREVKRFLENPKSEIRSRKEIRNPKSENNPSLSQDNSDFRFRSSDLSRSTSLKPTK